MTARILVVLVAIALVVALPFALKPEEGLLAEADDSLVIITPHNEAIRYEFSRAFSRHYRNVTGRTVRIDWRMPGGTSEIARYLKGEFFAAFSNEWKKSGREWTAEVQGAFDNPKIELPSDASQDTTAQAARRAFLDSRTGIGIDLFFGGGAFDFSAQAAAGRLVDSGVLRRHPDWFLDDSIPKTVSGEPFWDPAGRWIGAVVSSFGICYNRDVLERLGFDRLPASWADLTDPVFFKEVALADPTKSGSAAKAFEMIIQQQMQERLAGGLPEAEAVARGWEDGLRIIQKAAANARYFTDAAGRVPVDVAQGDSAIGMCIDFYGRYQSEAVRVGDSPSRLQYFTPAGGSSVGVDPIGMLRGAPNPEVAKAFIDFVLSIEGQKLWNFRVGTPGGPVRYALRRLPVRKELYAPEFREYRSDPDVFPYEEAKLFTYRPEWTGPLFKTISFAVRVMCLDPHDEQVAAWKALAEAGFPPEADAIFSDMKILSYEQAKSVIRPALSSADRIEEVRMAKELGGHFRDQYQKTLEALQP
ncbi:MAG: hypothetical protein Fur0032_21220 [Terrimicrobiaceae bacterium]